MEKRNICGQNIARLLNEHNITLMTLLVQLHKDGFPINYRHLQNIEAGKVPATDIEVAALAHTMGVPIRTFPRSACLRPHWTSHP